MKMIHTLLKAMLDQNASDLHLRVGCKPVFRINGELYKAHREPLSLQELTGSVQNLLSEEKYREFTAKSELDIGIGISGLGRFRVNIYKQRNTPCMAVRAIRTNVPQFDELNVPEVILDMCMKRRGFILVTGTTGSGKSTLLASMIQHINMNSSRNIVTIEDPIEFLYKDAKSIIAQREIGSDTVDFQKALRASFRQDPDVILIGEIRDRETMETALTASDTGHMVMSTLHTLNAVETINRIITFFPMHQHEQIRYMLSNVLVGVISLRLLPRKDGNGRVPATEILVNNANVQEFIRDPQKQPMIHKAMRESHSQYGSHVFDQSLLKLYKDGMISFNQAKQYANNPDDFQLKVGGISGTSEGGWRNFE